MILPITCVSKPNLINFKGNINFTNKSFAILSNNYGEKAHFLTTVCKEILSNIKKDKSLIEKAPLALCGIKLLENEIIVGENENNYMSLSIVQDSIDEILKIQIVENKKPVETLLLDKFNKIISSFTTDNINYAYSEDIDTNKANNFVEKVFQVFDDPLFQTRKFIRKNLSTESQIETKITEEKNIENSKNTEEAISGQKSAFMPHKIEWTEFSMREYFSHNNSNNYHTASKSKYDRLKTKNLHRANSTTKEEVIKKTPKENQSERENVNKVSRPRIDKTISPEKIGTVPEEYQHKFQQIKSLYNEIRIALKSKSTATAAYICTKYDNLIKAIPRGLAFKDISITFPRNKKYPSEDIIKISTPDSTPIIISETKNIYENPSGRKIVGVAERYQALSEEEIEQIITDTEFNESIDKVLFELKEFKRYIEEKGWYIPKDMSEPMVLNDSLKNKLEMIKQSFDNIHMLKNKINYYDYYKIKNSYEKIQKIARSTRLEFINPLNDGKNILFDRSLSHFGNIYKIIKYSNKKCLDEVFAITEDGKIVKNVIKNHEIRHILPSSTDRTLSFYTEADLMNSNILERLEILIDVLCKECADYEKYLTNALENKESIEKKPAEIKQTIVQETNYDDIKTHLDKIVENIQNTKNNLENNDTAKENLKKAIQDLKNIVKDYFVKK